MANNTTTAAATHRTAGVAPPISSDRIAARECVLPCSHPNRIPHGACPAAAPTASNGPQYGAFFGRIALPRKGIYKSQISPSRSPFLGARLSCPVVAESASPAAWFSCQLLIPPALRRFSVPSPSTRHYTRAQQAHTYNSSPSTSSARSRAPGLYRREANPPDISTLLVVKLGPPPSASRP
jgi:hypothetical protein